jgi:hypothetical protein
MFTASLRFDYVKHLDRHDRVRRAQTPSTNSRVRRTALREGVNT